MSWATSSEIPSSLKVAELPGRTDRAHPWALGGRPTTILYLKSFSDSKDTDLRNRGLT